jgi:hypothetical protein
MMKELMPMEGIHTKIYLIRGHRVMIDKDLAVLYKVTVFNLNKAVKRNLGRFPADFMFQLNQEEYNSLLFQIGISKKGRGGRRFLPYAFTEQGVAMLSSVLRSERAIHVNIMIMRAFVKIRQAIASNKELAEKLAELERRTVGHDHEIRQIFEAIKKLVSPTSEKPKERIGFYKK